MLGLRLLGTTGQRGPRKSLKESVVGKKRGPMPFMNPREPPIPQKIIEHGFHSSGCLSYLLRQGSQQLRDPWPEPTTLRSPPMKSQFGPPEAHWHILMLSIGHSSTTVE